MLLQSAGAVIMKRALVEFMENIKVKQSRTFSLMLNVHDEVQIECVKPIAAVFGKLFVNSIKRAGEHFDFKCPLDGDFKIGSNWAETH